MLNAAAVFPRMQRIASLAGFAGAQVSFPVPYRLRGIHFDTSLYTPNTLVGLCVVIGQDAAFIGYSSNLQVPVNHAAFPNLGGPVSESVFWQCPGAGILIPPNKSIALYGYRSGAGENMFGSAALHLEQE